MKISNKIADALLTVDDEAMGKAFKAAYATAIEHDDSDKYFDICIAAGDESYLCAVLLLEALFPEEG
jgi:hypothetical protein